MGTLSINEGGTGYEIGDEITIVSTGLTDTKFDIASTGQIIESSLIISSVGQGLGSYSIGDTFTIMHGTNQNDYTFKIASSGNIIENSIVVTDNGSNYSTNEIITILPETHYYNFQISPIGNIIDKSVKISNSGDINLYSEKDTFNIISNGAVDTTFDISNVGKVIPNSVKIINSGSNYSENELLYINPSSFKVKYNSSQNSSIIIDSESIIQGDVGISNLLIGTPFSNQDTISNGSSTGLKVDFSTETKINKFKVDLTNPPDKRYKVGYHTGKRNNI